jgi:hypothetical protein
MDFDERNDQSRVDLIHEPLIMRKHMVANHPA